MVMEPVFEQGLLEVLESSSASYAPRTTANARDGGLTAAFAVNFSTAGERLTRKVAGGRYVGVDLSVTSVEVAARTVLEGFSLYGGCSLNIAGNGIYTLATKGWSQLRINQYVFDVLSKVHAARPLEQVVSGGQTGADMAGVIAACALGIPARARLPRGFIQRAEDGIDRPFSREDIVAQVISGVRSLQIWAAARERDSENSLAP